MNDQKKYSSQKKLFLKIGFIIFLVVLLLIPMSSIQNMIRERQGLQYTVNQEIAYAWGNEQMVTGPLIVIPYKRTYTDVAGKTHISDHQYYLTPENVNISNNTDTSLRSKGIFNAIVYDNNCHFKVDFNLNLLKIIPEEEYQLDDAFVIVGVSDPSTIISGVNAKANEENISTQPGTKSSYFTTSGFHSPINLTAYKDIITYEVDLNFRGTTQISFEPVGKTTVINLASTWPSPSFIGKNLPTKREIRKDGFNATWQASEFNRAFPDHWTDQAYTSNPMDNPGVKFIETANHYQKNTRSIKYGFLIVMLSFVMFFSSEIFLKIKIHPIQYFLIGISLVMFYTLLLSLSEHIGFDLAYLFSSISVIMLIYFYSYSFIRKIKPTVVISLLFIMMYAFIFILLQLEDYALLAGSIGIFLILTIMMIYSRKVDWYNLSLDPALK